MTAQIQVCFSILPLKLQKLQQYLVSATDQKAAFVTYMGDLALQQETSTRFHSPCLVHYTRVIKRVCKVYNIFFCQLRLPEIALIKVNNFQGAPSPQILGTWIPSIVFSLLAATQRNTRVRLPTTDMRHCRPLLWIQACLAQTN